MLGGSLRYALGLIVFFIGIGFGTILMVGALLWLIPWTLLVYAAGWLSHVRPWPSLKHYAAWKWIREEYFHFRVQCEDGALPMPTAPSSGAVIYAIYPHGHYSMTAIFYWALNPQFERARPAVHSFLFWIPIFSSFVRWIDAIPVDEDTMVATLRSGQSIYMCPGGIADIPNTGNQIKEREGFLRVARRSGARVVPIWCPAERSYYSQWIAWKNLPLLAFPLMLVWGKWWCPILPHGAADSPILVGKTINAGDGNANWAFWDEMRRLQVIANAKHR